jgi:hypothetical protein
MDVPAPGPVKQGEGPRWGSWDMGADTGKRRRCVGVELNDIPLCGVCGIETAGESQGQVLERGLETIDRFDGGLSRDRLGMLSDEGATDFRISKRRKLQSPRQRGTASVQQAQKTDDRQVSLRVFEENMILMNLVWGITTTLGPPCSRYGNLRRWQQRRDALSQ